MQEFAPSKSRPSGNCPSDSELAAYIDGALGKEEATRVMAHLASCERCFEVHSETLRFQLDFEPVLPQGKVVPFPQKDANPKGWVWAAAAVLMVGLSGGVYRAVLAPPPELITAELAPRGIAEPLQKGPGLYESFWLGPTPRGGGGEGGEIPVDPASFQIGVQLVNLQVSLAASDARQVDDTITRILLVLNTQDLVRPLEESYRNLKFKVLESGISTELMGEANRLVAETRDYFEPLPLDFGQWVEAGRLATIAQEPSFFQRDENRRFLRRTIRRQRFVQEPSFLFLSRTVWRERFGIDDMTIDPAALQSLKNISEVLDQRDLSSTDYAKLRQSFDQILGLYYPS